MRNAKTTVAGGAGGLAAIGLAAEAFAQGQHWVAAAYALSAVASILLGVFAGDANKVSNEEAESD